MARKRARDSNPVILLFRPFWVFCRLFPFIIRFLRDWHEWILFGAPARRTKRYHQWRARKITRTLASLGPAFIKGAQVLSIREDLIPKTYTDELKTLQDRVAPFPVKDVYRIIEEDLGRPASEIFDSFDAEPLAAASLGQVHRAVYQGREVAVKILRPGVRAKVNVDISVVRNLLTIFNIFIDHHLIRSFWSIIEEYSRIIHQEMDFRNEELHAARFRRNFAEHPEVYIPPCYSELTTPRLVVFEFVRGARVDDPAALAQSGLTPDELVHRLIEIYVRMAVIHGFIHADPHPGNLLVDSSGRVVILDYGMALDFPEEVRIEMLRGCVAIVRQDLDSLVDAFYTLKMVEPDINRALVRDAAETLLKIQLRRDFTPRMVQEIADDILATFHKFPLRMPQQLVYLFRASALIEGIGFKYDPHFSGIREATPIIKRLIREVRLEKAFNPREFITTNTKRLIRTGRHLVWITERLEREELRIRMHQSDLSGLESLFGAVMRRTLIGFGAIGASIGGTIIYHRTGHLGILPLFLAPSAVVFVLCLLLPLKRRTKL